MIHNLVEIGYSRDKSQRTDQHIAVALIIGIAIWRLSLERTERIGDVTQAQPDTSSQTSNNANTSDSEILAQQSITADGYERVTTVARAPVLAAIRNALAEYSGCSDEQFLATFFQQADSYASQFMTKYARYSAALGESSDAEHLHTAALFEQQP